MRMEYVKQNKFYQADRINDHVLRISGMGGEKAYLIEGSDRALLFDGSNTVYTAARRAENYMPLYGGECDIVYSKDRIFGKKGKAVLPGEPYIDG